MSDIKNVFYAFDEGDMSVGIPAGYMKITFEGNYEITKDEVEAFLLEVCDATVVMTEQEHQDNLAAERKFEEMLDDSESKEEASNEENRR